MQPAIAPTLGRIVHYTCNSETAAQLNQISQTRYNVGDKVAAMITGIGENQSVFLTLFPERAEELVGVKGYVPFSTGNQPHTWTWPERAGETGAPKSEAA